MPVVLQVALQITRGPLVTVMQGAAINLRGALEKRLHTVWIKGHIRRPATLRFLGLEAGDNNAFKVGRVPIRTSRKNE